jgi:hypothetical protein
VKEPLLAADLLCFDLLFPPKRKHNSKTNQQATHHTNKWMRIRVCWRERNSFRWLRPTPTRFERRKVKMRKKANKFSHFLFRMQENEIPTTSEMFSSLKAIHDKNNLRHQLRLTQIANTPDFAFNDVMQLGLSFLFFFLFLFSNFPFCQMENWNCWSRW